MQINLILGHLIVGMPQQNIGESRKNESAPSTDQLPTPAVTGKSILEFRFETISIALSMLNYHSYGGNLITRSDTPVIVFAT